jgi:geranylgeranyl diphosphate synthase type I
MSSWQPLRAEITDAHAWIEQGLAAFFQQNAERYAYGELFEPIYLDLSEFVSRRGKRIRPLLFLLAYRIFGGQRPLSDPSLLRSAISLELLHAFILIHDDIIDRSERRRGLPTFHKRVEEKMGKLPARERIGQNVAMVVGDMLFALAVDTLQSTDFPEKARSDAQRRFLRYVSDTGCGEVYDILLGSRDIARVTEEDITQMYHLKTTRYTFEAPFVLGGILAEASADVLEELSAIIEPVGLAFQMQNDLVEYSHFDLEDRALQTDLLEGKKTFLFRMAYDRLSELDRSFLQLCLTTTTLSDSSILKIKELIDKSRAVDALRERIRQLFGRAEESLKVSSLTPAQQEGVREAIDMIRQQTSSGGAP